MSGRGAITARVGKGGDVADWRPCPFDDRLARTPYLVLPKLAIQAMPMEWRERLEALLVEAEEAGIETPEYHVFRAGHDEFTRARIVNEETGFVRLVKGREDPWANYRHGDIRKLCPRLSSLQPAEGEG